MIGQAKRIDELNKLQNEKPKIAAACPIYAFTSGKGGTGKSFVSLNLALATSTLNKRVLMIDLDLNLSNQNILVNVSPEFTVYDYFMDKCLLEDCVHEYSEKLHFIFGESGKIDHPNINSESIAQFFSRLNLLSYDYDLILIDTSSGAGDTLLKILNTVDLTILVTTPEPTSIMDSYVIIKLMNNAGIKTPKTILMNKSRSLDEGKTAAQNLQKAALHFLKERLNLLGILEYSPDVSQAIMAQTPYLIKKKGSIVSKQLMNVAYKIVKDKQLVNSSR